MRKFGNVDVVLSYWNVVLRPNHLVIGVSKMTPAVHVLSVRVVVGLRNGLGASNSVST